MLVGDGPSDPCWLGQMKLPRLLTAVPDGTSLHPVDRHKPHQLLLRTDLNSYNILPSPAGEAGSALFIVMLSFLTVINNIQFQKFTPKVQKSVFSIGISSSLVIMLRWALHYFNSTSVLMGGNLPGDQAHKKIVLHN